MKRTAWIVVGWLVLGGMAQAASFDCEKASTKVEHLICDSPELSKLDYELAASYKAALQGQSKPDEIRLEQKRWMKERNSCVDDACVNASYHQRIGQFKSVQAAPTQPTEANLAVATDSGETACLSPQIDWRNYRWMLIAGKGEAICEEMLAYVKSRPKNVAPPTCPDERLPPNGNWTRPEIRDVSEEERQAILKNIPEQWRQKDPSGSGSYEKRIANSGLLRVIRGDITRDGIPESFLAFSSPEDPQQTCERSKRCAVSNEVFTDTYKYQIHLIGDSYDLLPMNDEGTQVNWSHATIGFAPMLMGGELIYYKGQPYWMRGVSWGQASHDDFLHSSMRPDDPYSAIFGLNGIGHSVIGQYGGDVSPAPFSEVQHIRGDGAICRIGYFHRDNLKLNPPNKGR